MENEKKINWFIGHMKRTVDILESKKKNIDFVIEVVDARLPYGSSNFELLSVFENKPIIKIALKSDLVKKDHYQNGFFYASIKNPADRKKIINHIDSCLKEKKDRLIKKGLRNPTFIGIVVGLPNIGKSSLINYLSNKKSLNVENRPGVTRKTENIKISESLFLIDTPGVFLKNVTDYQMGLSLALINCVKREVIDKKDLILFLINKFIENNNLNSFNEVLNTNVDSNDPNQVLFELLKVLKVDENNNQKVNVFYDFIFKKTIDNPKICLFLEKI